MGETLGRDIGERDEMVFLKEALAQDETSSPREAQEPVAWLETLKGLASSCPELHKRIYHAHEVDKLEDWAANVLICIEGIKETTE
jgi:hypothetical protein